MSDTDNVPEESPPLTEYAELHGCSCKVSQSNLESLLSDVGLDEQQDDLLLGVGEDAAAQRLRDDLALVTTVDFFTPIIDDPYDFGRVAACNAASDAFATGAIDNVSCLVVLGLPREVTEHAPAVLAGIIDALAEMDGTVAGGHTILNPWPFAGGAVTATTEPSNLLSTSNAAPGERLYLTKPLGTQPAMGALRVKDGEFAEAIRSKATRSVDQIGEEALSWMTTPNREAAAAAGEYASAATDVTGFGLLGQAQVLAKNAEVGVEITTLPVIDGTIELSHLFGYGLEDGESAETSGGLLLSVPPNRAAEMESALADAGVFYRQVGRVTDGTGARLVDPTIDAISR